MRQVIGLLAFVAGGMVFILYVARPWPDSKLFGSFFLAVGVCNVLFYKSTGRRFFAITQSSRSFIAHVWAVGGEKGLQVFVLGMGIILALAGCVVIIVGRG